MKALFFGALLLLISGFTFSACSSLTGGDSKKLVVNENVCRSVDLLRMKLGQETKIVLDNTSHSDTQTSLTLQLPQFPIVVTGELPPNTSVGTNFTTVQISAPAGETNSVTIKPIFTGDFTGICVLTIKQGAGGSVGQKQLTFQIVD